MENKLKNYDDICKNEAIKNQIKMLQQSKKKDMQIEFVEVKKNG